MLSEAYLAHMPYEAGVAFDAASAPYATSLAKSIPATKPLEPDDPYAPS